MQKLTQSLESKEHSQDQSKSPSCDPNGLSVELMKTVLAASPAGIGIVKGRILGWANENLYSLLGYELGSLEGKNAQILYPTEKEYEKVRSRLANDLEKYGTAVVETRLSRKDGITLDCRIRTSYLDPQDLEKGCVVVITDISELKSLQIQLQAAQKMEAIGVLAGGISHDFNNILMGVQGHLSLMRVDGTASEKIVSHIHQIAKLVDTAAELTGRLLGFARGGKYQIADQDFNLILAMALNIFKPSRKDIVIHESFEKKLHRVEGDHSQLEQVCLNLLVNASQAMIDPGEIFVSTQNIFIKENHEYPFEVYPGQYIEMLIRDTGIGMDMKTQKKIFDPFFSTKALGDTQTRGLGLSTVFGIVKNHEGFITVKTEKGKGSSFKVCLPASSKVITKGTQKDTQFFEQMPKGSETILLVDDEEKVLNIGKNFLEKLGYKVIIARNGLEAVKIFSLFKDRISLVVLDLLMPEMDGTKVFSEIKKIQDQIRFLITSGTPTDEKVEGFLHQGCHEFIQKPYALAEFSKVVRTILDKKSS
jgi:two-component system cell cycle sensor histidine kinase/response regulator CckA